MGEELRESSVPDQLGRIALAAFEMSQRTSTSSVSYSSALC